MASEVKPLKYLNEVRAEARKVTWPTRKETMITTIMVLVMVVVAALFFFVVDQVLGWGIRTLFTIGR